MLAVNIIRKVNPMDSSSYVIDVKVHFKCIDHNSFDNKIDAMSDGSADSCILGMNAKALSYTGKYTNLVGYDPINTKTEKVPIVIAILKVRSSSSGIFPVLLQINDALYIQTSQITLISEHQVREYGLTIDSIAKKHFSALM